jgi:hypothetical protein
VTAAPMPIAFPISIEREIPPAQGCGVCRASQSQARLIEVCSEPLRLLIPISRADSASKAAQLALLSRLDSTDAPKGTVFVFTCNSTVGLEPRFLSRCLPIDFSSYGMAGDIVDYLDKVWHAEGGNGNGPDFGRLAKECRNDVRDCLGRLEVELMAL